MVALEVLAITFLVLLFVGLFIYTGFFALNKIYLKRLTKLMDRYNKIASQVYSINFYKIEILMKNDLPIKIDLNNLKSRYASLGENISRMYLNLVAINEEINTMNLKPAKEHLNKMEFAMSTNEKYVADLKKQYDNYTSYGDYIDEICETYLDIYDSVYNFYKTKIAKHENFKPINDLFVTISHTISQIPGYKLKSDYKKMVLVLMDLRSKLTALVKSIETVLKFQIIAHYLIVNKNINERSLNASYGSIDSQDIQWVKKLDVEYKQCYTKFFKAYIALDFKQAKHYSLIAASIIEQINKFVYIHTSTQDRIDLSLAELEKQTKTILANKDKITNSINAISRYFMKDPIITKSFKKVLEDLESINRLSESAKVINSKTYTQKLTAIRQIAIISSNIYNKKESIKNSILNINETLSTVIQIVSELNDLYIYFNQLLNLIRKTSPTDEIKDIESLIKNNLELVNDYSKAIVSQEHPNYIAIYKNINNMIQSTKQLTDRLEVNRVLRSYATKLIIYCNRYKDNKENLEALNNATKLYKEKKYSKCIESLLSFIKKIKKGK